MNLLSKIEVILDETPPGGLNEVDKKHKQLQSLLKKINSKLHNKNDIDDIVFLVGLSSAITSCFIGDKIDKKN